MRILLVLGAALVLSSCNAYFPHLRVIRANYQVSRGEYQPAIVDYLRAREGEEFQPWLSYNLGTVYHYLGESGAAVDQWELAISSAVPEAGFGASFNRGVYLFEQGRYGDAFEAFRYALQLDPGSRAAKTNMELTLQRLEARSDLNGEQSGAASASGGGRGTDGGTTRMLDYIRRKQEQQWRANNQTSLPDGTEDW